MPSDRDLAQQWLAERIVVGMSGPTQLYCEHPDWGGPACRHCLAAAILDTPGVEVAWEAVDSNGHLSVLFEPMPRNSRRVVIRLPYEPGVAAHQQDCTEKET